MLMAVEVMDPTVKMLFFGVSVACFVVGAVGYSWGKLSFVAAGLALFAFPWFWDALAAS
ncbi:MAG TPA: hypothetical protein VGJ86_03930 [Acidimicrobiales bacterium]